MTDGHSTPTSSASGRDWLSEARAALAAGDSTAAVYAAREALALDDTQGEAWTIRSRASRELGRTHDAVSEAREAVRLEPTHAVHQRELAEALHDAGANKEAVSACEAALRLDPADTATQTLLTSVYFSVGRHAEALRLAQKSHQAHPADDTLAYLYGTAIHQEAIAHMTSVSSTQYEITNAEQAAYARQASSRGLALRFAGHEDLRARLRELGALGDVALQTRWGRSQHLIGYIVIIAIALVVAPAGFATVQSIPFAFLCWGVAALFVWLYIKRHRKPNWMWAAERAGTR